MLDKEYEPKPVYNRLLNLIQKEWKTNLEAQTNEKGQVSFRGFCGAYDVVIKMPDGRAASPGRTPKLISLNKPTTLNRAETR